MPKTNKSHPHKVTVISESSGRSFDRRFKNKWAAELFILTINLETDGFHVLEYNFTQGFTTGELRTIEAAFKAKVEYAKQEQNECWKRTARNQKFPEKYPCEICGESHRNYECCENCNLDNHTCHFCGDNLGHGEISACYILEGWGD